MHRVDPEVVKLVGSIPGHEFLSNPTAWAGYAYLADFIATFSTSWTAKKPEELDVLDWGAGRGQTTWLLTRRGLECTPADLFEGDGVIFGERAPLLYGRPAATLDHPWKLPFPDGTFDVVLSVGVLEHVPDDAASLRELRRVLRPNGLFFCFNLPAKTSWTQRVAHVRGNRYHDRLYGGRQTERMVSNAGFAIMSSWRRQLLPKNTLRYPAPYMFERLDQLLTEHTPLGHFATSLEFVATTAEAHASSQKGTGDVTEGYFDWHQRPGNYGDITRHFTAQDEILDLGCGTGWLADFLPRYTGLDNAGGAVETAATAGRNVVRGDVAGTLPFEDNHFDGVVLKDVLEHVPDPVAVVREVCRVLHPGGRVYATSPDAQRWVWDDYTHRRPFTQRAFRRMFEDNGFVVERSFYESVVRGAGKMADLTRTHRKPLVLRLVSRLRFFPRNVVVIARSKTSASY